MAVRIVRHLLNVCICVVLLSAGSGVAAERLIGLGVHQETGRDIYLGGLYLNENTARPADLRNLAAPRVMEYRVVARRTSIRSLLGGMLLQSEIATGKQPTTSTTKFADALLSNIKSSLYAGDSLRIALTAGNKTVATLNGHTVATTNDPEVSNYLLAGWLSENGASTQFRRAINAPTIDQALLAKLETTKASDERNATIAASLGLMEPADREPETTDTASANTPEPVNTLARTDAAAQPANNSPADIFQPESSNDEFAAQENTATPTEVSTEQLDELPLAQTYPTLDSNQPLATASPTTGDTSLPALNLEPTLDNLGTTNKPTTLDGLGDLTPASASVALSSQDLGGIELDSEVLALGVQEYSQRLSEFHNDLVARVYRNIKYPKRAVRRSLEGRLELDITLRKSGELVNVAIAETSGHPLLDAAALEAAETAMKSANFSTLDAVAVAEFAGRDGRVVVPVPVNFQLTKK